MPATAQKKRILTGDTPTGPLHLGHYVGSIENRVTLQEAYECFFIIANMHAFTTHAATPKVIRQNVEQIVLDYLAAGIDPQKSAIFLQSEVPAIAELSFLFSMLIPLSRVLRNPTIKNEIREKKLGDNYPFGFLLYPIGQAADILSFRPDIVPVGEDQIPHLELTREISRKFNQLYCGVSSHTEDKDHVKQGGLFPLIEAKMGRQKRLVGIGNPDENGTLLKMSKSLNNAIFLSDDADTVRQKVMQMYTDPKRLKATDPGTTENNPLWIFHETFNPDKTWVAQAEEKYRAGKIGDVECKKQLIDVLNNFLDPIRKRRDQYKQDKGSIQQILKAGTERANEEAEKTLLLVKKAINQDYFKRNIALLEF